jgi:hypothetical protein
VSLPFGAAAVLGPAVPSNVVAADLNHNGILDLAIANKGSRDVSVLLGRGGGAFESEVRFPLGGRGADVLLSGDVDADGHVDLIGLSLESNHVFLLLGNGDGTFRSPVAMTREILETATDARSVRELQHELILDRGTHELRAALTEPPTVQTSPLGEGLHPSGPMLGHGEEGGLRGSDEGPMPSLSPYFPDEASPQGHGEGRLSLADVLVVGGPGFTTEVELGAPGETAAPRGAGDREEAPGGARGRAAEIAVDELSGDRNEADATNRPDDLLAAGTEQHDAPGRQEQAVRPARVPSPTNALRGEPVAGSFVCALLAFGLWLARARCSGLTSPPEGPGTERGSRPPEK